MKTVCKKLLSLMLVAVLLVSAIPMMASAAVPADPCPQCSQTNWDSGVVTTPATCTSAGVMTYTCQNCQNKVNVGINPTGHNWSSNGTVVTAATCTTDGVMSYPCLNSGCTETTTSPIPATGHTWVQTSVKEAATCGKDGVAVETCSTCQTTREVPIPATGAHTFGSWTITKKATATTDGEMTRVCSACGATETQTYKATVKTISFINSYVGTTQTTKVDYVVGDTISLPAGTPVAGYTFKGWFTEANGNGSQLTDGTTCTDNLASGYYAYYIQDVKFDYDVYLNIYTNNKVDEPAKRINITSGIASDGTVSLSEVKSVVQNYYTSKDSNGITYDGLYMATGDWVDKFNRNDKEDTFSNIGDLKEQNNVFINVMITNVKEKTSSSSGSTADSSNPKTGDGIYTTVAVFGLSVASLAAVYYISKKRIAF